MEPPSFSGDVWQNIFRFLSTDKERLALASLCKMFNKRVAAVMLGRKQLHVGAEVTVHASQLARWPHLPHMECIVIHALVLDGQDTTVFLQCPGLVHIELRVFHSLNLPTLRLPAGEPLAGSIAVHHSSTAIIVAHGANHAVPAITWHKVEHAQPQVTQDSDSDDGGGDEAYVIDRWEHAMDQQDAWDQLSSDPEWLYAQMELNRQETKRHRPNTVK